ncbi:hypothetical protein EBU71_16570 [bacterium]|nr:hypothetical protein [Candidatus Elulimicrobium humile]
MIGYVFDVDGVLCDRNENINQEFKIWFKDWAKDKEIYFITGSERYRTIEQIGMDLVNFAKISFHCLGNSVWIDGKEFLVNQIKLTQDEYDFLSDQVRLSKFMCKTGNHIELRKGSVNFSIIGKNASRDQRKLYIDYDKIVDERLNIIKEIKNTFPRLDAFLGGDVSIDICLRGADKAQCYNLISTKILHFFGDRTYPYGIDYPFAKLCTGDCLFSHQIDHGYQQTWDILKSL